MEFRKCSINGKIYHGDQPLFSENNSAEGLINNNSNDNNKNKNSIESEIHLTSSTTSSSSSHHNIDVNNTNNELSPSVNPTKKPIKLPFVDSELTRDLSPDNADSAHAKAINDFFTLLAICHTVLISTGPNGEIQYKAQSPDEAALVQAAKDVGFTFYSREQEKIVFTKPDGERVQYKILNIIEFTSARKRMSIITQCPETNKIILFSKGADNVIFERLKPKQEYSLTAEHLEEFAKEGRYSISISVIIITGVCS